MLKTKSALFVLLFALNLDYAAFAKEITVTTFNIQWYGSADPNTPNDRDQKLKDFLTKHNYLDHDILVFQEIVDHERLKKNIIGPNMKCQTYNHDNKHHQHVVVCFKASYVFETEPDDNNYAIEKVALGNPDLRPAVHGILKLSPQKAIRLLGVHLKAKPQSYKTRTLQASIISEHLEQRVENIPTIILGDFNIFQSDEHDDYAALDEIFSKNDLTHIPNEDEFTFRNGKHASQLDHVWLSSDYAGQVTAQAFDACQDQSERQSGFYDINFYNKFISDHCPVTVKVEL